MNDQAPIPTLLFTFSSNGEFNGQMLVEATAEELMEQDRSVAPGAYKRHWFGSDSDFEEMLANIGFPVTDKEGIVAALRSHRDASRKLEVSREDIAKAAFAELAQS